MDVEKEGEESNEESGDFGCKSKAILWVEELLCFIALILNLNLRCWESVRNAAPEFETEW